MWKSVFAGLFLLLIAKPGWCVPQRGLPEPTLDVDRSTPAKTVELFQSATEHGQFLRAAYALDLRRIAKEDQAEQGPELARQLRFALDRLMPLTVNDVSNEPAGSPEDGASKESLGEMRLDELVVPVELQLVSDGKGGAVWVFGMNTVREIATLYDRIGPGWLGSHAPAWSFRISVFGLALWQLLALALVTVGALIIGAVLARVILALGRRIARQTENQWDDAVLAKMRAPGTVLLGLVLFELGLGLAKLTQQAELRVGRLTQLFALLAMTWLLVRVIGAISEVALSRIDLDPGVTDAVVRHGRRGRISLTRQVGSFVACFVGLSLGLMQFESVRQIGVSLLASAGVIGVVVGIAAQKSVANLLAGIQLSWAQPIRIGDRVKVLDDVGWIEEVTFTYVAMKTWDGRRRIFPITYFTENQFENWSRTDPSKIATVLVHADYALPVEPLRQEARRWLAADPDWDGSGFGLVVFDTTETTLVIRVTASAADAGRAFDLGCRLREAVLNYLQAHEQGRYLPRRRILEVSDAQAPVKT